MGLSLILVKDMVLRQIYFKLVGFLVEVDIFFDVFAAYILRLVITN